MPGESYIVNLTTGEKMAVRIDKGTFVFDVEFSEGESGAITLDSGAGVNVWPKNKLSNIPMMQKKKGLKLVAANGTDIQNFGQKVIKFRGFAKKEKEPVQNTVESKSEVFIRRA